jgi:hypothetical protein
LLPTTGSVSEVVSGALGTFVDHDAPLFHDSATWIRHCVDVPLPVRRAS